MPTELKEQLRTAVIARFDQIKERLVNNHSYSDSCVSFDQTDKAYWLGTRMSDCMFMLTLFDKVVDEFKDTNSATKRFTFFTCEVCGRENTCKSYGHEVCECACIYEIKNGEVVLLDDPTPEIQRDDEPPVERRDGTLRWRCLICGRDNFARRDAHRCGGNYRKSRIPWQVFVDGRWLDWPFFRDFRDR